ncbi:MAG: DUF4276 family protein [candidate division Zixibacteria bacterium]|nr:DUF4276 family protein [Candidatus Tariuqbacter arcticus]
MVNLIIIVEGQTEEAFIKDVLTPHLSRLNVFPRALLVTTKKTRIRRYKGGGSQYKHYKKTILNSIKQFSATDNYFSSMIDLYKLPRGFPGNAEAQTIRDKFSRISFLEDKLKTDINHPRNQFMPYLQLHEFEAILFSKPDAFKYKYPFDDSKVNELKAEIETFTNPELIDDDNPPSKRIKKKLRTYEKVADAPILALEIGLDIIRQKCPHFNEWISKLESLSNLT